MGDKYSTSMDGWTEWTDYVGNLDLDAIFQLGNEWIRMGDALYGEQGNIGLLLETIGWSGSAYWAARGAWDDHMFAVLNQAADGAWKIGEAINAYGKSIYDQAQKMAEENNKSYLITLFSFFLSVLTAPVNFAIGAVLGMLSKILGSLLTIALDVTVGAASTFIIDIAANALASAATHTSVNIDWNEEGKNIGLGGAIAGGFSAAGAAGARFGGGKGGVDTPGAPKVAVPKPNPTPTTGTGAGGGRVPNGDSGGTSFAGAGSGGAGAGSHVPPVVRPADPSFSASGTGGGHASGTNGVTGRAGDEVVTPTSSGPGARVNEPLPFTSSNPAPRVHSDSGSQSTGRTSGADNGVVPRVTRTGGDNSAAPPVTRPDGADNGVVPRVTRTGGDNSAAPPVTRPDGADNGVVPRVTRTGGDNSAAPPVTRPDGADNGVVPRVTRTGGADASAAPSVVESGGGGNGATPHVVRSGGGDNSAAPAPDSGGGKNPASHEGKQTPSDSVSPARRAGDAAAQGAADSQAGRNGGPGTSSSDGQRGAGVAGGGERNGPPSSSGSADGSAVGRGAQETVSGPSAAERAGRAAMARNAAASDGRGPGTSSGGQRGAGAAGGGERNGPASSEGRPAGGEAGREDGATSASPAKQPPPKSGSADDTGVGSSGSQQNQAPGEAHQTSSDPSAAQRDGAAAMARNAAASDGRGPGTSSSDGQRGAGADGGEERNGPSSDPAARGTGPSRTQQPPFVARRGPGTGKSPVPVARQLFRTDSVTGETQLVDIAPGHRLDGQPVGDPPASAGPAGPAGGRRLDGSPVDESSASARTFDDAGTGAGAGGADGAGRYRYYEVDPATGVAKETTLGPNDSVVNVKPVGGKVTPGSGFPSGKGGAALRPAGDSHERVATHDSAEGKWDVVDLPPKPAGFKNGNVNAHSKPAATSPRNESYQLLRRKGGDIDLLTYRRRPADVPPPDGAKSDGTQYHELGDGGQDGWHDAHPFGAGAPKTERIITAPGKRLDGKPAESSDTPAVLVRDEKTGLYVKVESFASGGEAGDSGGRSYYRIGPDGRPQPIKVSGGKVDVVRVSPNDGKVTRTTFSVSGGDGTVKPYIDKDGTLTAGSQEISPAQLRFDTDTGRITHAEQGPAGSSGSGSRGGSDGPGGGGRGTATRSKSDGSQTQTESNVWTLTDIGAASRGATSSKPSEGAGAAKPAVEKDPSSGKGREAGSSSEHPDGKEGAGAFDRNTASADGSGARGPRSVTRPGTDGSRTQTHSGVPSSKPSEGPGTGKTGLKKDPFSGEGRTVGSSSEHPDSAGRAEAFKRLFGSKDSKSSPASGGNEPGTVRPKDEGTADGSGPRSDSDSRGSGGGGAATRPKTDGSGTQTQTGVGTFIEDGAASHGGSPSKSSEGSGAAKPVVENDSVSGEGREAGPSSEHPDEKESADAFDQNTAPADGSRAGESGLVTRPETDGSRNDPVEVARQDVSNASSDLAKVNESADLRANSLDHADAVIRRLTDPSTGRYRSPGNGEYPAIRAEIARAIRENAGVEGHKTAGDVRDQAMKAAEQVAKAHLEKRPPRRVSSDPVKAAEQRLDEAKNERDGKPDDRAAQAAVAQANSDLEKVNKSADLRANSLDHADAVIRRLTDPSTGRYRSPGNGEYPAIRAE
ncbi:hypothetical protein, partial [Actinoallomurus rhizosphaericola]|uniref:hypothetical protein n=1 Tax=Actinoallomurus rhizosphaericola TaxID=2952536 RepID=UPI0038734E5D|nr:hypothetical protein [Actinoallomurus rhizosphaericola]